VPAIPELMLLENAIPVSDAELVLKMLKEVPESKWSSLVNVGGGRWQTEVLAGYGMGDSGLQDIDDIVVRLTEDVSRHLKSSGKVSKWDTTLTATSVIGLKSTPGCKAQVHHNDFSKKYRDQFSILLAVDTTKTFFEVCTDHESEIIEVPRCSLLVFDGQVTHGGAAYCEDNMRLFWYAALNGEIADQLFKRSLNTKSSIYVTSYHHDAK
jgi:hypothetical protein